MADGNFQLLGVNRDGVSFSYDVNRIETATDGGALVQGIVGLSAADQTRIDDLGTKLDTVITNTGTTYEQFEITGITVTTTIAALTNIDIGGYKHVGVEVANTGGNALNAFVIDVRYHPNGTWHNIAGFDADYDSGTGKQSGNPLIPIIASSGIGNSGSSPHPTDLAGGATAWIDINTSPYASIRFRGACVSGTTSLVIRAVAK